MVSLLVPVYNRVEKLRFLLPTFKYEYDQFHNFEVIIIDDKSTDGTFEYATQFCSDNSFCKLISSGYRSPGISRNLGAKVAKYDWVLYCDSDNKMINNWPLEIGPILETYKDFNGIWFPAFSNNSIITSPKYVDKGTHQIEPYYYFNNYIGEVVHCVKRDFLVKNNYYYIPGYSNDFPDLLWFELFSNDKYKVVFCNKVIQVYHNNESNRISSEVSMNKIESQIIHYNLLTCRITRTRYVLSIYYFKILIKLIFYLFAINRPSLKNIQKQIGRLYLISRVIQFFRLDSFFYNVLVSYRKKNESIIS